MNRSTAALPLFAIILLLAASCGSTKSSIYFRQNAYLDSSTTYADQLPAPPEVIIQTDDIISVNISSESSIREDSDPVDVYREGGTAFSVAASGSARASSGSSASRQGYLVDKDGFIDFPVIGKLKVGGLNMREAKELIAKKLKDVIKNPVVEVRILNFKVTLLGEVGISGPVIAANQRLNIVEAIATAGDIPITGNRENILLIREENGQRTYTRLNLNSRDIFRSPYYYLKQNDIVYVEPNRIRRQQNNEFFRIYLPAISTLISTALAIYGIVRIANQ